MSCYHPLLGRYDGDTDLEGKKHYKIVGFCKGEEFSRSAYPGSILIPCGHCLGCRLDNSRAWADRMILELNSCDKKGIFLTLTYNNENITWCKFDDDGLPLYGTLVKDDLQRFMKRLRKYYSGIRIRFYACGEYGDRTQRPHYHCILFGISLADVPDLRLHGVNELKQNYYISDTFARIWNNGFVLLSDVSWKTCAYVSRYVTKKLGQHELLYDFNNQQYPFALMSRKPGIGRLYLDEHPDCLDYQTIALSDQQGSVKIRLPKYFIKTLEQSDPDRYNEIMLIRKECAENSALLKLQRTDLGYLEYLEKEECDKIRKVKSLTRASV